MTGALPAFTTPARNRAMVLARRPGGNPEPGDFALSEGPVPVPGDGEILVRNLYLSADPVQRGWAANPALMPIGAAMRALAVGVVIDSRAPGMAAGDVVYGMLGWQDYALAARADLLSHSPSPRAPLPAYAGVLGMPGVTAWLALHDLAPPLAGRTVLVSTAAGSVGSVVGQIARQAGAHVLGLTGSEGKVAQCTERFGYHQAFDYHRHDLAEVLERACPGGFDLYFDNVGGAISDMVLRMMAKNGRIIQCGTAATASWSPPPTGLRPEREILMRTLTWSGFVIFDHADRFGEATERLTDLLLDGKLSHEAHVETGIERVPEVLAEMLAGRNQGKTLIWIGD